MICMLFVGEPIELLLLNNVYARVYARMRAVCRLHAWLCMAHLVWIEDREIESSLDAESRHLRFDLGQRFVPSI